MRPPSFTDVLHARRTLARLLPPTPLWSYPVLDPGPAAALRLKLENTQPTGAFKVRGGLTLLAGMSDAERARGIVGYSTGNHAQSLAYAAARHGAPCVIVMPERPDPGKARAVRALGAELVEYGETFDQARPYAEKLAAERGMLLVSAANEPALVAGVATAYLEVFEQAPDTDTVIVPVGGGSGAAAACLVAAAVAPGCRIVAVQSDAAPAAYESWRAGGIVERPNRTRAAGLATGSGFELTQAVMREGLHDFVLVSDDAITAAQAELLADAHVMTESAGAAALAALRTYPERFAGRRVVLMCSGGNASEDELRRCLRVG
ncbi:pyridoxal-phosphate dependent enzyme [Streptomyces sp. NPDC051940]|uniref:threonine ammonia-lyase n=1 Tax=Streptomyces sp. NPDC051940 TaxID=3155675 RepID=UPI003439E5A7